MNRQTEADSCLTLLYFISFDFIIIEHTYSCKAILASKLVSKGLEIVWIYAIKFLKDGYDVSAARKYAGGCG